MRHFILPRPVTALTRSMREATGAAVLITHAGGALRSATRRLCAIRAAVTLTAIAGPANDALAPATGAEVKASGSIHRQSPCRHALDLRGSRRDTCSQPCLAHGAGTASVRTWRFEPMPCRSSRSAPTIYANRRRLSAASCQRAHDHSITLARQGTSKTRCPLSLADDNRRIRAVFGSRLHQAKRRCQARKDALSCQYISGLCGSLGTAVQGDNEVARNTYSRSGASAVLPAANCASTMVWPYFRLAVDSSCPDFAPTISSST